MQASKQGDDDVERLLREKFAAQVDPDRVEVVWFSRALVTAIIVVIAVALILILVK